MDTKETKDIDPNVNGEEKTSETKKGKTAKAEAKEKDLALEAKELMKKEGVDTIHHAGNYWFKNLEHAEAHAKEAGDEVMTFKNE